MLVGDGKIGWDDRAREHLPELDLWDPWITEHITVRDMLSHRTGADFYFENLGAATIRSHEEWVARLKFTRPSAGFRENYVYSNSMYVAAAMIAERTSGSDWNTFARERIWGPLGMERTNGSRDRTLSDSNHATAHFMIDGEILPSDFQYFKPGTIPSTGNVRSTASEMGRWLLFHLGAGTIGGREILTAPVVREMHLPQIPIRGGAKQAAYYFKNIDAETMKTRNWSYGMAWMIHDYRNRKIVWHGGTLPGYRCMMGFMPDDGVGVYVGVNRTSLLPVAIFFRSMDALLGQSTEDWSRIFLDESAYQEEQAAAAVKALNDSRVADTTPTLDLGAYQGDFSSSAHGDVVVRLEGPVLRIRFGVMTGDLEHWHYDTFKIVWDRVEAGTGLVTFAVGVLGGVPNLEMVGVGEFDRMPER